MKHISENLDKVVKNIGKTPMGIRTGITKLDDTIRGLLPGNLYLIGARPSVGKTSILADIALSAAREAPAGIFSLEMPEEQIKTRLLCNLAGLNYHTITSGKGEPSDLEDLKRCQKELEKLPILINDETIQYVGEDKYWMGERQIKKEQLLEHQINEGVKQGIKLFLIDYLQLVHNVKPTNSKYLEVGSIARCLRDLAKMANIPIVLFSQLRRFDQGRSKEEGKKVAPRPSMDDLRDSGNLEEYSNVVVLIHRPEYYKKHKEIDLFSNQVENDAELIVEKNRNGMTGSIRVAFHSYMMGFRNLDSSVSDNFSGEF